MKKLILVLFFFPLISFSQKINNADALKLCISLQGNNFASDELADNAINKILSVIGASQKPILQACNNINNAIAVAYKGQRYILYDRNFMNSINSEENQYWSNMFILAHEIGHHINGHSLDILLYANDIVDPKSLEESRQQELEADEFAGFVLAKLGATLKETSLVMQNIPLIDNENTSTHPIKDKRIIAARKGYKKGKKNLALNKENDSEKEEKFIYTSPSELITASDYFNRGIYNQELFKNIDAILDYTKAIELDPDFTEAYLKRASLKQELEDFNGALNDYNFAIESQFIWYLFWVDYVDANTYFERGRVKNILEDYNGAIKDLNKAIEIDKNLKLAYLERGNVKVRIAEIIKEGEESENNIFELGDLNNLSYRDEIYYEIYKEKIEKQKLLLVSAVEKDWFENYNDAIDNYNKVIELDPNYSEAYFLKGRTIMERDSNKDLKDYYGAIDSYNKAIEISPNIIETYYKRANIFISLNDYENAIMDYNKIINYKPSLWAYIKRIGLKEKIGLSACSDIFEILKIASKSYGELNNCEVPPETYLSPFYWGIKNGCWSYADIDRIKTFPSRSYYLYYKGFSISFQGNGYSSSKSDKNECSVLGLLEMDDEWSMMK